MCITHREKKLARGTLRIEETTYIAGEYQLPQKLVVWATYFRLGHSPVWAVHCMFLTNRKISAFNDYNPEHQCHVLRMSVYYINLHVT